MDNNLTKNKHESQRRNTHTRGHRLLNRNYHNDNIGFRAFNPFYTMNIYDDAQRAADIAILATITEQMKTGKHAPEKAKEAREKLEIIAKLYAVTIQKKTVTKNNLSLTTAFLKHKKGAGALGDRLTEIYNNL